MPIGAALLGGAAISAFGASKAASAQKSAANSSNRVQERIYDEGVQRLQPYTDAGRNALAAYMYELGLGPAPTVGPGLSIEEITTGSAGPSWAGGAFAGSRPTTSTRFRVGEQTFDTRDAAQAYIDGQGTPYGGMSMSPSARFLLGEGRDTIEAGAASRGGLYSGAALQGLERFRQNIALGDRENQLNRLLGLTQTGQSAAAGQGAAGINFANAYGNNLQAGANAAGAGYVGVGNAVNDGIGNYMAYQNYNRLLDLYA